MLTNDAHNAGKSIKLLPAAQWHCLPWPITMVIDLTLAIDFATPMSDKLVMKNYRPVALSIHDSPGGHFNVRFPRLTSSRNVYR